MPAPAGSIGTEPPEAPITMSRGYDYNRPKQAGRRRAAKRMERLRLLVILGVGLPIVGLFLYLALAR